MDDEFSDDGFDDLNDTVLRELENNAIQATQAQKFAQSQAAPPARPPPDGYGFDDDDLDDTIVIDERSLQPPRPGAERIIPPQPQRWNQQFRQHPAPPPPQHQQQRQPTYPPRPQYQPPSRPVAPIPSQRFPPGPIPQRPAPSQSQFARPPPPIPRPFTAQSTQALPGAPGKQNDVVAALQARLSALESELTTAKGEAAILRSKYEKAQVAHGAEISHLKKQSAEHVAKQERRVEEALAAERTATTELQFARQDLREELGRVKSRKKDGPTTPRKNKSWGIADGFDGLEMTGSPSKTQAQKKKDLGPAVFPPAERTPTKGKRKRPAVDSPTFALETHSGEEAAGGASMSAANPLDKARFEGLPFDFLKLALDHSPFHGQPLTFDLFSRFMFPSTPEQTFSSIIFQKLPQMGNPREPMRLLIDFAQEMIDLWQRCLSERYHAPIYYLAVLVLYVLQLNTVAVAPHIISSLIPVCTTTCRLVGLPRFKSVDGDISQHPDNAVRQLDLDGCVTQSLSLLYLAALGCLSSPNTETQELIILESSPQVEFWKTVDMEFVVAMLSPKQPELDWYGMLSLLWASVLPDSIGPIPNATSSAGYEDNGYNEKQTTELVASAVIERVSICLVEQPRWAAHGSLKELLTRLAVIKTLILFATSPFGILQIARSNVTIQRLVTVFCWAVDRLYDVDTPLSYRKTEPGLAYPAESRTEAGDSMSQTIFNRSGPDDMQVDGVEQPSEGIDPPGLIDTLVDDFDHHSPELLSRIVAQALFLLHTLITDPRTSHVVDMTEQLATCSGGSQRYLLTLARLSFAEEELVYEAEIDANTVDLAHELLEMAVTPDEGEEVGGFF